jgi:hypothetical protein
MPNYCQVTELATASNAMQEPPLAESQDQEPSEPAIMNISGRTSLEDDSQTEERISPPEAVTVTETMAGGDIMEGIIPSGPTTNNR